MTRSAEAALDESQLRLGEACERLLASDEWIRTTGATYKGLLKRLAMIPESGLPRMRLVPNSTLESLGRIPRSHEGYQVDAIEAVTKCGLGLPASLAPTPKAVVLFYSHSWKRPNWCESLGKELEYGAPERQQAMKEGHKFGDPDDASHSKAKELVEYAKWFTRLQKKENVKDFAKYHPDKVPEVEVFWWIDYACTDQDNAGPDMAALPAFAAACAGIVAAWSDRYSGRAWCRVELLVGYAFMVQGNEIYVLPAGFANGATKPLGFKKETTILVDPVTGNLTNEKDRKVIESLTGVAERSTAFSCWNVQMAISTMSPQVCCLINGVLCGGCCGMLALASSRTVKPGTTKLKKLIPLDTPSGSAPSNASMARVHPA